MKKSSLPGLPASVRVGPFDYLIRFWTEVEGATMMAQNKWGLCKNDELEICLLASLPLQAQAEVLLHEVLHAIWNTSSVEQSGDDEEKLVTKLSYGLLQVIRDNPGVMSWIAINAGRITIP